MVHLPGKAINCSDSTRCLTRTRSSTIWERIKKRLGKKVIMFTDRARQHQSKKVQKYLQENKDSLRMVYLPKGSPEFNAVEECW
ncbi:MAG: transposase [Candidatus Nitrosocosmicus sp.]